MRVFAIVARISLGAATLGFGVAMAMVAFEAAACVPLELNQDSGTGSTTNSTDPEAGAVDAGPKVVGAGCGTEQKSGIELCIATSKCPNVVIDTQAMPSCGFRIRNGVTVDIVCACGGTSICPMGVFTTCAEAAQLTTNQTEGAVCAQVAEGRCTESAAAPTTPATSSSSSGGGNQACDKQCMKDCGGGAACASVCNCD